ncbi:MAG: phasin family protein [Rhodospirillales bacterium]|nr:phasin family protein [Rhodospirillales bacterium]MDE0382135.1 phasin family protein [Rhodospirillales bacterium]
MTVKTDAASKAAAADPKTPWNGEFSFDTMADEGRASLQSFVQASTIAAKGYGAIGNAWFDFAKETMAAQAGAAEAIMGARSWAELTDAQTVQAKGAFERTLAAGNRIADMTVKTTGEAMEPIRARTEDLVGRYAKPAV